MSTSDELTWAYATRLTRCPTQLSHFRVHFSNKAHGLQPRPERCQRWLNRAQCLASTIRHGDTLGVRRGWIPNQFVPEHHWFRLRLGVCLYGPRWM